MSKNKFDEVAALSEAFEKHITVDPAKHTIVVPKDAYIAAIGEDKYKTLSEANDEQLKIDQAFAHAATKQGYSHMQNNSDVDTVSATVKQYSGRELNGSISRSTRVPSKEKGGEDTTKPGGARWSVGVAIKSAGFKTAATELANTFFGK